MSPQYLSPGVYVEEVDKGSKPIEGVGTSVAAFVGFAEQGPVNYPTFIANWSQFTRRRQLLRNAPGRWRWRGRSRPAP
jgi:phage tail sheath protein FI